MPTFHLVRMGTICQYVPAMGDFSSTYANSSLSGHQQRVCKIPFHPHNNLAAKDNEASQNLKYQPFHFFFWLKKKLFHHSFHLQKKLQAIT